MERNINEFINVGEVSGIINSMIPEAMQESWDNSGLLIGFSDSPVRKIMTSLELNAVNVEEAINLGIDMVVTHHPIIFGSISKIDDRTATGKMIMKLIRNNISVYSCHTPFDKVKGGNNDIIAELIGLTSVKTLSGGEIASPVKMAERMKESDIGRIGKLRKEETLSNIITMLVSQLRMSLRELKVVGELDTKIKTIGVCTGAGADMLEMAVDSGCDLFITGDVKYHEAMKASELGICLIDAGHYHTEKFFGDNMKKKLEDKLGNKVEIISSDIDLNPFNVL